MLWEYVPGRNEPWDSVHRCLSTGEPRLVSFVGNQTELPEHGSGGTEEFLVVSLDFQELLIEDFIETHLYVPTLSISFPFNPKTAVYCCRMELVTDFKKCF